MNNQSRVSNEFIHVTDWLPTFYSAAGGDLNDLVNIDGVDQWANLNGEIKSSHKAILLNIDEISGSEGLIMDEFKLIKCELFYEI